MPYALLGLQGIVVKDTAAIFFPIAWFQTVKV